MTKPRKNAKRGEPLAFFIKATSYRGKDCLLWPFAKMGPGYACIFQNGRTRYVHRLVCEKVHGKPPTPKHHAAHSCRNAERGCIAPGHLSWKTAIENQADRVRDGTHIRGEKSPNAKLTRRSVLDIRKSKESGPALAARYGVSRVTISKVRRGLAWGPFTLR